MKEVNEKEFNEFMQNKKVKKVQGDYFHSNYYVDENNIKIAYVETSSWGAPTIYKINNSLIEQQKQAKEQ